MNHALAGSTSSCSFLELALSLAYAAFADLADWTVGTRRVSLQTSSFLG